MKQIISLLLLVIISLSLFAQDQDYKLETVIQRGHKAAVRSLAYSPNGQFIATGSRDVSIKIWEVATGREIRTLLGHLGSVSALAFDPTGVFLASGSSDNEIVIWEVATGKEVKRLKGPMKSITSIDFSHDGLQLASSGTDRNAITWNIETGQASGEYIVYPPQIGAQVRFSKDDKTLITGNDNGMVKLFDQDTKEVFDTLRNIRPTSCGGCPTFISLNENGDVLLSASDRGPITLWDIRKGKKMSEFGGEQDDLKSVDLKGNTILIATDDSIKLWKMNGQLLHKIGISETKINEARLSPDGRFLAIATNNGITQIRSAASGKVVKKLMGFLNDTEDNKLGLDPESYWQYNISKYVGFRENIAISPDEKYIVKGHYGTTAQLWDLEKGRVIRQFSGHEKAVICYQFSKDSKYLFTGSGDGTTKMWEVDTGKGIKTFNGHHEMILSIAISNKGKYLATGSWDGSAILWDIESGEMLRKYTLENHSPYSISFAQNDLYLIIGGLGKSLQLVELDSGLPAREFIGHTDIVSNVDLHNDELLTASWDGTAKLWDLGTGLISQKFNHHASSVYDAAFSEDGKLIATASADRTIMLWDKNSGELLKTFKGHSNAVTSVDFINNNNQLISHSLDGTTKIWDIATNKEMVTHILIGSDDWLVKTENGFFDATENAKENIFFVKGMKSYSLNQFFEDFYRPGLLKESMSKSNLLNQNIHIQQKLESSPPPSVEIISPTVGEPISQQEINVMIKITNQGGGIDEVKLLHNGKRLTGDDRAIQSNPKVGKSVYQSYPVRLIIGKNVLSVSAFSEARIESDANDRELHIEGVQEEITCHVMAIGINQYKNPSLNLNYAFEDAESFLKLVKQRGKKLFNKTVVYSLFNEEATKANILAKLDEIIQSANPQDVFFFYYAGHGSMVDGDFYFIPTENIRLYDIELLADEAIQAGLLQQKFAHISALKQMVVIDACQSGGSTELLATRGASEEKAMAQLSRSSGVHVLAASGSEQFATEFKELGHGLFTYVLLEALSGKADGAPKDGKVTIYELKAYIDSQVPEYSSQFKGKPQYPVTYSKGQDFPVTLE